jgi:ferric-dicitrate binding protein FerR (iron transport regulator)
MTAQENLILRYLEGKLTDEERAVFKRWLSRSDENVKLVKDFERVWKINHKLTPSGFQTDEEWQKLQIAIQKENHIPIRKLNTVLFTWKVAAAIAFLILSSFLLYITIFQTTDIIHETAFNQTVQLTLPDSSKVWLNENTRLTYNDNFNNVRELTLAGEAFFEVKRNPSIPFIIKTSEAQIKVMGTSFNVKAYNKGTRTEVYVVTGKVSFATVDEGNHIILTAGTMGVLNKTNHTLIAGSEEHLNITAWKNKELVFQKTPLREVLESVRSYFKTDIEVKNEAVLNCRFTSSFKEPTLPEVMEAISLALNLKVDKLSNTYVLEGEGCNAK